MTRSLQSLVAVAARRVRPPERLTVTEAAEKYRYINNPGTFVGKYRRTKAPYMVEVQDALASLDHTGLAFVGPARCGKSDIFFNWQTYTQLCDPTDMMFVHMTKDKMREWSQGDLKKAHRDTRALGRMLIPGTKNQNVGDSKYINGTRLLNRYPTVPNLSSISIPRLFLTDYDRMEQDLDKEGTPYDLAKMRAFTYKRFGMCAVESSPGFECVDPNWIPSTPHEGPKCIGVVSVYNKGDRRRWYWPCHRCEQAFEPSFKLMRWEDTKDPQRAAETAHLVCPHCEHKMFGHQKDALNNEGKWVRDGQIWRPGYGIKGEGLVRDIASFWLKGPAACFAEWETLVSDYVASMNAFESTGSDGELKVSLTTKWGEVYTPPRRKDARLPEEIRSRAADLPRGFLPPGVRFLVATVDVQATRFVVQVHGFGIGGDIWLVDRFDLFDCSRVLDAVPQQIDPATYPEDWNILISEVIDRSYPLSDGTGRRMSIKAVTCDSGGGQGKTEGSSVTNSAYAFWRHLRSIGKHQRFYLTKGGSTASAPPTLITYPDNEKRGDRFADARGEIPVLQLNPWKLKDRLNVCMNRRTPGGGFITFPQWLDVSFFVELTAEVRTAKGWEKRSKRNEAWDLLYYAVAATVAPHIGIMIDEMNWSSPPTWARDWDQGNDFIFDPDSAKPRPYQDVVEDPFAAIRRLGASLG